MKNVLAVFGAVFLLIAFGLFALCNDEDEDSFGPIRLVSHEYDERGDYSGDQDYEDQWSNEDRNRNRQRDRGAFSPGPFDDSPVDAFNGNVVCLPGSTCYTDDRQRDRPPPGEQEPQSVGCLVPAPFHCDPHPKGLT